MMAFVETALGMILIFLFASLVVTAIQEIVAGLFSLRAKSLEGALKAIIDGKGASNELFAKFVDNPLIKALHEANGGKPSYIPARSFAAAVMSLAPAVNTGKATFDELKSWAEGAASGQIGKVVNALITETTQDVTTLQKNVETWFDETMDRLTGWYKRWTQFTTLLFGLLAAALFNINSIAVWDALSSEPAQRTALAAYATAVSQGQNPPQVNEMLKSLQPLKLPIGWPRADDGSYQVRATMLGPKGDNYGGGALMILGWLITALAASLGSAFWFDLLKRFVQIRGAGPKPAVVEPDSGAGFGVRGGGPPSVRPALLRDRA